MIIAEFEKTGIAMSGHAGAGKAGEDVVCAGATTLAYTLGQALLELEEAGCLKEAPEVVLTPGEIRLRCVPAEEWRIWTENLFHVFRAGYELLGRTYPKNVFCMTAADAADIGSAHHTG